MHRLPVSEVDCGLAGIGAGEVLFEYTNQAFRTVSVTASTFHDWFGPHDAHIYRFTL